MLNDLHPYDGVERRFSHCDENALQGREVVAQVLGLPTAVELDGIRYDLSFYSGGTGVFDRLAIAMPVRSGLLDLVLKSLNAADIETVAREAWVREELLWLLTREEDPTQSVPQAAIKFINDQRRAFQQSCDESSAVYSTQSSNVNYWTILWASEGELNLIGCSQG